MVRHTLKITLKCVWPFWDIMHYRVNICNAFVREQTKLFPFKSLETFVGKFCRKIKLTCSISAGITLFKELLHCDSKCILEVLLQVHFCYESCSNLMFFTRYKINAYSFWFAFCKFQEIIFPKCFLPCSSSMLLYYFYHGFVLFCLKTPWLICFK